jgi:hypothetical protein
VYSCIRGTTLAEGRGVIALEDFTALSRGSKVLEGRVGLCPKCGRNGVEHSEPEALFFIHAQKTELLGDGMLTEPRDCCRLTGIASQ